MTLSLDQLTHHLFALMGNRGRGRKTYAKLNTRALSERDMVDLNLPFEMENRLRGRREAQRIRGAY